MRLLSSIVNMHTSVYLLLLYAGSNVVMAEGPAEQEVNRILGGIGSVSPVIEMLIGIAVTLVFLYFFWGLVDYIRKDQNTIEDAKKRMLWGIIGIFVLTSVWGLVYFLQTAVLGTNNLQNPDIEFRKVESTGISPFNQ